MEMLQMILSGAGGLAAGWLGRGFVIYHKARKDFPFTLKEATRLILRGGRA